MNPRINQLVRTLLKKDTLEQCSLPELQEFADRHPYFGAAQLLLTKKLQTDKPELYDEQLQKTFLFFHNPMWVEHLLSDNGKAEIIPGKREGPAQPLVQVESPEPEATVVMDPQSLPEVIIQEQLEERIEAPAIEERIETAAIEENEVEAPVVEASHTTEEIPTEIKEEEIKDETVAPANLEVTEVSSVSPKKDELLFEPFHTVDYFASQGIKLKDEDKPQDKFGQQLKSFTQWLRTMKRLPVTEIVKNTEPGAEKKVEEMAAHSLQEKEVITEAMAEVWEKQGNNIKAIDIYGKLSLLEPAKSAYFAAKIEALKKLN